MRFRGYVHMWLYNVDNRNDIVGTHQQQNIQQLFSRRTGLAYVTLCDMKCEIVPIYANKKAVLSQGNRAMLQLFFLA